MIKFFTLAEASKEINLPVEVITEAANTKQLYVVTFNNGKAQQYVTDEEIIRWARNITYQGNKKMLKEMQKKIEFTNMLSEFKNQIISFLV